MITQSRLRDLLSYDPNTGRWTWVGLSGKHAHRNNQTAGSLSCKQYRVISIDGKRYYASRLAFLYMTGILPDRLVDHIDGDTKNDCWVNLRLVDFSQNGMNRKPNKNNPQKNISKLSDGSFRITVGKIILNGFKDLELAKLVASEVRGKLYGEFARE